MPKTLRQIQEMQQLHVVIFILFYLLYFLKGCHAMEIDFYIYYFSTHTHTIITFICHNKGLVGHIKSVRLKVPSQSY